jgi:CBS domain-containing protein
MQVRDRMTKNPVTVTRQDTLAVAHEKTLTGHFRHLPVIVSELTQQEASAIGASLGVLFTRLPMKSAAQGCGRCRAASVGRAI